MNAGEVLSPLLWKFVMDELLCLQDQNGQEILGYADDLVSLAQVKHNYIVSGRMEQAMNIMTSWNEEEGLKISASSKNKQVRRLPRIQIKYLQGT